MKANVYCGLRSIGWCLTNENNEVVKHGVKRVNIDFDSYYQFLSGQQIAKRIDRRMKRTARRNLWRYKTRRHKLVELLKKKGMYPTIENLSDKQLFELRSRATKEILSPTEIGRVLLHLSRKRGYKSQRGVDETGASEYLKEIQMHEQALQNFSTVSEYLMTLDSAKDVIIRRETYLKEFELICQMQNLDYKLFFDAIYFQRPLKKGKIGNCKYEKNRKVTHYTNPIFQEFRIWRDVMNIEIFDRQGDEVEIDFEIREKLVGLLKEGFDITKAKVLKYLGITKPASYTWFSGKAISGDYLGKIFKNYTESSYDSMPHDVWQDLISATETHILSTILDRKYGFFDEMREELLEINISSAGHSDISVKAITKLLPHLQSGMKLKEAVMHVYGKVDFEDSVHLRNVVLEQVFKSAESLISELKKYYEIDSLQLEIDSLLKMGNKSRKALSSGKRKSEKTNKEATAIVKQYADATDYNLKKYRLWLQFEKQSPYEPGKEIPLDELFTEKYNLDHVVPKSKLMEFSENNLVLCPKTLNENKNRTLGFDFAKETGIEESYLNLIESLKTLPERKRQLLLMTEDKIPTDWVSSNAGTDYNTKCFLTLHKNTVCIPNKLINMFAKKWYAEFPENDVRNSLIKALTIANMSEGTLTYFDNIKKATTDTASAKAYDLQPVVKINDLHCNIYVPRIKFFRKTSYGYTSRFNLHKETVYGKRSEKKVNSKGEIINHEFFKIRQSLSRLTANMVENIMDKSIQRKVQQRINEKKDFAVAMESFAEAPISHNGKPIKSVSIRVNSKCLIPLHSTNGDGVTGKANEFDRKTDFVYSAMHHYVRLINKGNKFETQAEPLIQSLKKYNEGTFEHHESKIQKSDILEFDGKQFFVVELSETKISVRETSELNAAATLRMSKELFKRAYKLHINQLGIITKREKLFN